MSLGSAAAINTASEAQKDHTTQTITSRSNGTNRARPWVRGLTAEAESASEHADEIEGHQHAQ